MTENNKPFNNKDYRIMLEPYDPTNNYQVNPIELTDIVTCILPLQNFVVLVFYKNTNNATIHDPNDMTKLTERKIRFNDECIRAFTIGEDYFGVLAGKIGSNCIYIYNSHTFEQINHTDIDVIKDGVIFDLQGISNNHVIFRKKDAVYLWNIFDKIECQPPCLLKRVETPQITALAVYQDIFYCGFGGGYVSYANVADPRPLKCFNCPPYAFYYLKIRNTNFSPVVLNLTVTYHGLIISFSTEVNYLLDFESNTVLNQFHFDSFNTIYSVYDKTDTYINHSLNRENCSNPIINETNITTVRLNNKFNSNGSMDGIAIFRTHPLFKREKIYPSNTFTYMTKKKLKNNYIIYMDPKVIILPSGNMCIYNTVRDNMLPFKSFQEDTTTIYIIKNVRNKTIENPYLLSFNGNCLTENNDNNRILENLLSNVANLVKFNNLMVLKERCVVGHESRMINAYYNGSNGDDSDDILFLDFTEMCIPQKDLKLILTKLKRPFFVKVDTRHKSYKFSREFRHWIASKNTAVIKFLLMKPQDIVNGYIPHIYNEICDALKKEMAVKFEIQKMIATPVEPKWTLEPDLTTKRLEFALTYEFAKPTQVEWGRSFD